MHQSVLNECFFCEYEVLFRRATCAQFCAYHHTQPSVTHSRMLRHYGTEADIFTEVRKKVAHSVAQIREEVVHLSDADSTR